MIRVSVSLSTSLLLGGLALSTPASAQTHRLPYAQAGAALAYAQAEVRILHDAVTANRFDLGFTRSTLGQLELALAEAKRNVDRAETLLPEKLSKRADAVRAVRDAVVAAETQRDALAKAVDEQTKVLTVEDEAEAADLPPTDWDLLERETGWLAVDIRKAVGAHRRLLRPLRVRRPGKVKKPRGKRD
jgi:hypothetical protein